MVSRHSGASVSCSSYVLCIPKHFIDQASLFLTSIETVHLHRTKRGRGSRSQHNKRYF